MAVRRAIACLKVPYYGKILILTEKQLNKIQRKMERAEMKKQGMTHTDRTDKEEHTRIGHALKVNTTQLTLSRIFKHSDFMN